MARPRLTFALLAGGLFAFATAAFGWPQIPSQNVGLGAQSAYSDHGNATCSDGLGGAFVAWTDVRGPMHVYVQHVDGTGAVVAGWPVDGLDVSPSDTSPWAQCDVLGIYPCGTGSAIVAWIDWDIPWDSYSPFWAQRVADPAAGGLTLWTAGGVQATHALNSWWFDNVQASSCAGDDNSVLFAFTVDGDYTEVQKIRADGTRAYGGFGSVVHGTDFYESSGYNDWNPRPVPDGQGGAFVIWEDGRTNTEWETAIQHVDSNGNYLNTWPDDGILLSFDPFFDGPSWHPDAALSRVAPDGTGGALVTWVDFMGNDGSLAAQRVAADGTLLWDHLGSGGTGYDHLPVSESWNSTHTMCPDGSGGFYFAWANDVTNLGHVTAGGALNWSIPLGPALDNYGLTPDVIPDGLGGALVAWARESPNMTHDIATQHVDIQGNMLQTAGGAMLTSDTYEQLSPKAARDGGIGAVVNWIDARPVVAKVLEPLAGARAGSANLGGRTRTGRTTARRNGATARVAPDQAAGGSASMFAQQVNSVGALGGVVISAYTAGVTPDAQDGALAVFGGAPNPAVGRMRIAFTLPTGDAASLEVLDVTGRRVWSSDVGKMGAGRHIADLGGTNGAAPGLYFVRLRQAGRVATGKVLLTR